ncbi:MAG: cytochrome P450 [Leptolyngbyaceae cyanobacterium]
MAPQNTISSPLPPGSFGLPLLGETLNFFRERDFIEKRRKKYGNIFKTHIFGRPTAILLGAEANRFILTNEHKYFAATWPKSTRILLGANSLAVRTGNFHTSRRKLMYQAFQPRALASYLPVIEQITTHYLEKWQQMGTLPWYSELRNYTFDIACKLFVGKDNASETHLCHLFEDWCAGLFSLPIPLPWTRFGKARRCREGLLREIEGIILQRQQEEDKGEDALGILLNAEDDDGNRLSLDELKDQILLLLFAGHETLTSALASFCLLMSENPEVLERVRQEQEGFATSVALTTEQLKQMTYLEQVLKEVLRLIPPVGGGFREVITDCQFQGYRIPQGWNVQYPIGTTHQDETLYPNRQQFDPQRFSPENAADKQPPFGYIPFGGGLRECLGKEFAKLEMKIFAAMVVRHCQWELLPNQDLTLIAIPTPHPRDGLQVKFHWR